MKKIILLLIGCMLIHTIAIAGAEPPPGEIVTIWGKIYNYSGDAIGGLTVNATNLNTGNTTNNVLPVTSEDGYQIQLGNLEGGWNTGDEIKISTEYHWLNITWYAEESIIMEEEPPDTIEKDLHLEMNDLDNITLEDIYILLLIMQGDIDDIEEDIGEIQTELTTIQQRLENINETTLSIQDRLGYEGESGATVYDDLTEILLGLIYEVDGENTTWAVEKILENQTEYHEELLTILENSTGNISIDSILEKIDILQNTSEDLLDLNVRMFGKINTTINKQDTSISKLDDLLTKTTSIDNIVDKLGGDSETIDAIEQEVSTYNETLTDIQGKISDTKTEIKNTQGTLGTVMWIVICIGFIVLILLLVVFKEPIEEVIHARRR